MLETRMAQILNLVRQAISHQEATTKQLQELAMVVEHHIQDHRPHHTDTLKHPHCHLYTDSGRLCLCWKNRHCKLEAPTLFRLAERLCRRPNYFVRYEDLLVDVWKGDFRSTSTVRSAIRRLKNELRQHHMSDLANSIQCRGGRYAIVLDPRE